MTGTDSGRFAPKVPVQLDPPKDDLITTEELAKCDGTLLRMNTSSPRPCRKAILYCELH